MGFELKQTGTGIQLWEDASSSKGAIVQSLNWVVNRAPTNTTVVGTIPANAQIISILVNVPVVSNAVSTATVSVGLDGGSATAFTATQDVKSAITSAFQVIKATWATSTASQNINCTYTETGGASTTGTIYVTLTYAVN